MEMFLGESLATQQRISVRDGLWGKQVQGRWNSSRSLALGHLFKASGAQHLPGRGLHPGRCSEVPGSLRSWVLARQRPGSLQASWASSSRLLHHCLTHWKLFKPSSFWTKFFRMSPWKRSLLILAQCTAFKKNEAHSRLDSAPHTNHALHFHGLV